jgi:hypothetical protein
MPSRAVALLLAASLAASGVVRAEGSDDDQAPREGRFTVQTAYSEQIDTVHYLNADIDFQLSAAALKALESSLPLTVKVEIEIFRDRRLLWAETVARLEHVDQIAYHPLTQRYLVRELATGEVESFASYRAAIARLGQVSDVPLIDAGLLDPKGSYRVRIRAVLDLSEYAAPLRVYASLWDSWTTVSDWYEWRLQ